MIAKFDRNGHPSLICKSTSWTSKKCSANLVSNASLPDYVLHVSSNLKEDCSAKWVSKASPDSEVLKVGNSASSAFDARRPSIKEVASAFHDVEFSDSKK